LFCENVLNDQKCDTNESLMSNKLDESGISKTATLMEIEKSTENNYLTSSDYVYILIYILS